MSQGGGTRCSSAYQLALAHLQQHHPGDRWNTYLFHFSDGDNLPDEWETAHGLNPNDSSGANGASGDPDGDGLSNLQEYIAGTNPQNSGSRLKIESINSLAGGMNISFLATSNRTYSILYRDSLESGGWIKLTDITTQSTNQNVTVSDDSAPGQSPRFYRLATPAIP